MRNHVRACRVVIPRALVVSCGIAVATVPLAAQEVDRLHPMNFVRVWEVRSGGPPILVFGQETVAGVRHVRHDPEYEIDRHSAVRIDFDRDWMAKQGLDAAIMITGRIANWADPKKAAQDFQIPGYSLIGKESQTAILRVPAQGEVQSLLKVYTGTRGIVSGVLDDLKNAGSNATEADRSYKRRADEVVELETLLALARTELSNVEQQAAGGIPSGELLDALNKARTQVEQRQGALTARREALARDHGAAPYVRDASERLTRRSPELVALLQRLTKSENAPVLRTIAQLGDNDYELITATAERLRDRITKVAASPLTEGAPSNVVRSRTTDLEEVREGLNQLQQSLGTLVAVDPARVSRELSASLKDVELPLAQTPAEENSAIFFRVQNYPDSLPRNRSVDVRMNVTEFGWVRQVRDSYLFIHRLGLGGDYRDRIRGDSTRADSLARTTAAPQRYRREAAMNFDPALGVTLAWTYYARRQEKHAEVLRWLQPTVGVNVSFPRFAHKVTAVSLSDAGKPDSPLVRTAEETRAQVGLSTGVVGALFNGAVQASYGYSLSTETKRRYWALGFSFLEIAKRLAEAGRS